MSLRTFVSRYKTTAMYLVSLPKKSGAGGPTFFERLAPSIARNRQTAK